MEKIKNNDSNYKDIERFNCLVDEAKNEILSLLKDPESMPKYMTDSQLHSIIGELNTMRTTIGLYDFYPYYPKGIVDCWVLDDPLAIKLGEILELYNRLKRVV